MIQESWVAVTSAASVIVAGGSNGVTVRVRNSTGTAAYLGGSGVSGTSGYPLGSAESVSLTVEQGESLYAATASGTATLQMLQVGVGQ